MQNFYEKKGDLYRVINCHAQNNRTCPNERFYKYHIFNKLIKKVVNIPYNIKKYKYGKKNKKKYYKYYNNKKMNIKKYKQYGLKDKSHYKKNKFFKN